MAAEAVGYEIIREFISRQHAVCLVRLPPGDPRGEVAVCKRYDGDGAGCEKEANWLAGLAAQGVAVPRLLAVREDYLLLEYLTGPTLLDILLAPESAGAVKVGRATGSIIAALGDWYETFYAAAKALTGERIAYGDVNFRNFIVRDRIYGIDPEDCRSGRPEEDAGKMAAFALTYTPAFTPWKRSLARALSRILIARLRLDAAAVRTAARAELSEIERRRGQALPPGWERVIDGLG